MMIELLNGLVIVGGLHPLHRPSWPWEHEEEEEEDEGGDDEWNLR